MVSWHAAVVALDESKGMSAEEIGTRVGEFFAKSWLTGAAAAACYVPARRATQTAARSAVSCMQLLDRPCTFTDAVQLFSFFEHAVSNG
jgi:hypothetical protein